ncbi:MAG TPA: hypothetical protein VLK23_11495 [Thermodesulfobacteriota bacterium]|nr:hypothetical protein [Thermodesulfobacteriota bacterium]
MSKSRFIMMFMCIAVGTMLLFIQHAMAAKNVNIDVNPSTSTPGGISPDIGGVNAVYNYTVYDGESINDTIPVQICMTGYEAGTPNWISIDSTFGSASGNLNGVTLPADEAFSSFTTVPPNDCRNLNIQITSGPLSVGVGNYNANVNLGGSNPNPSNGNGKPQVVFADIKNFHIRVTVLTPPDNVSCFLTDSSGLFLTDCTGALVTDSGSDDGRFAIVANKKSIQVSTNPGQFYYNLVWLNTTGSEQTVDVNFDRTGVIPKGAQAIHSAVFNGYLSAVNPPVFDEANSDGIPDGQDDQALGIVVPAGSSLLVTYHLTWAALGNQVLGDCALNCGDSNQLIEVTGTVSGSGITTESCTSSALGYKK